MPLKYKRAKPQRGLCRREIMHLQAAQTLPSNNSLHCCLSFFLGEIVVIDLESYVPTNNVWEHTMLHVDDRRAQRRGGDERRTRICCGGGHGVSLQQQTTEEFAL